MLRRPGPSWYGSGENWAFVSPQLPGTAGVGNLLSNGSFESSSAGWDRLAPAGVTVNLSRYEAGHGAPAAAHDGSWYLATNTSGAGGSVYQDVTVNAGAGTSFVATAWLSAQSGTAAGELCLRGLAARGPTTARANTLRFRLYPAPGGGTTDLDTASLR